MKKLWSAITALLLLATLAAASNLTETATWDATVNKIDNGESITENLLNASPQALANRTQWLKVNTDAHTVDGFHASQTPGANQVVVVGADGLTRLLGLFATKTSGAEGGEIALEKPETGSTLAGNVAIDLNGDTVRFFEAGGSSRGFFLNISKGAASAATSLRHDTNTFHGRLSGGTAVRLPPGWASSQISTGLYRVTHNLGHTNYTVTPVARYGAPGRFAHIYDIQTNYFDVAIKDAADAPQYGLWHFSLFID